MSAPTYPGDTVLAKSVASDIKKSKSKPDSGIVTIDVELLNQRGDVLQSGADIYMVEVRI